MGWILLVILIVASIFFVWQLALFVRDLVKHIKNKKAEKSAKKENEKKED